MSDNWKGRPVTMLCSTCMYYVPKESTSGSTPIGRCRRNAPTMKGFVPVYPTDWCGEHRLDEEKLAQGGLVPREPDNMFALSETIEKAG